MWLSVMAIFIVFAVTFIVFDDYDRKSMPLDEAGERHLLVFAWPCTITRCRNGSIRYYHAGIDS